MANPVNQRAIVIGGSITGILVARVLSDHFQEVVIVERDQFPQKIESRGGVPQDRHGHLLMARGQEIIERLVPEITADFHNAGLHEIRWGLDTRVLMSGGWMAIADTGIRSFAASRLWLEHHLRQHILQHENISVIQGAQVTGLCADESNSVITGITYKMSQQTHSLQADLVIDASGRRSQSSEWLVDLGYDQVPTTTIDPKMGYATRWYEKPANTEIDWKLYISYARPEQGLYRSGAIVEVEDNKWVVILGGTNGDYAPTDEEGYQAFLESLAAPELANYLNQAEPLSPTYGYRHTANHWRHYEKMDSLPQQFIMMGDAVCAFNPVYAQGMSVSALQVEQLETALHENLSDITGDFTANFQTQLATIIQDAWGLSATADALLPNATGDKPHPVVMLGQQYITKLTEIMPYDAEISASFLKIMHMQASPVQLFHPRTIWKFLRFQFQDKDTLEKQSYKADDTVPAHS